MKIGFIGLGIMGKPMAKNLMKAGYALVVNDLNRSAVAELVSEGAEAAQTNAEVARECGIIITMLPNSPHVREAVLGAGGVIETAAKGTLLIDMSSIAPKASQEIAAKLAEKGVRMLDAPVSGGEPKAIDGSLAIMVGGSEADFNEAKPILDVLGASAVLIGDIGSGNTCKLANQVIVAANIAALAEGLTLAKKAGASPERVFEAIRSGLAGSTVMNAKAPMMLEGNFKPGFRIELHIKDLANALDTGYATGAPLPISALTMQMLSSLRADGDAALDHSALAKYYAKLAGTELSDK